MLNGGFYYAINYAEVNGINWGAIMKKEQSGVQGVYQKLQDWLENTKDNEVRSVIDVVEQAKSYLYAAEQIPEQQVKQFIACLLYTSPSPRD